jgi:hypothetical protein
MAEFGCVWPRRGKAIGIGCHQKRVVGPFRRNRKASNGLKFNMDELQKALKSFLAASRSFAKVGEDS